MNGVIILDKPTGISSAAAVNRVKRLLPRDRPKLGHAGTLDPFASGVLLLLVGRATRSCEALMNLAKTYHATVRLGATTVTDDPESPEVLSSNPIHLPSQETIENLPRRFVGTIQQRPPSY